MRLSLYSGILAATMVLTAPSLAATVDLTPTADGDVQIFGGDSVETTNTAIAFTQSGGLARNAILEFDLSSIANGSTINSVTLDLTLTRFVSNLGSAPAAIDVFAYIGDGVVNIDDFAATGTQVADTSTPHGGTGGDVRSFSLSVASVFTDALVGDLLTLRIETDNFASINFAALENSGFAPANLSIDFTPPSTVPVPAALPLLAAALGLFGFAGWRRRNRT